jgi:hypothetical protein
MKRVRATFLCSAAGASILAAGCGGAPPEPPPNGEPQQGGNPNSAGNASRDPAELGAKGSLKPQDEFPYACNDPPDYEHCQECYQDCLDSYYLICYEQVWCLSQCFGPGMNYYYSHIGFCS